jgi:L-threonylcarbamoyladenylate synthase
MGNSDFRKFNIDEKFEESIAAASELYLTGRIFIYPTDTIYGMGGDPFNQNSVRRINTIKGRAVTKRYIWLVSSLEILLKYANVDYHSHISFLKGIYPAPVTLILDLNKATKDLVGFDSAAFRIPDNHFCRKLLAYIQKPLISTSVNWSGEEALIDYREIERLFNKSVDALFYTSAKINPVASTIIDLRGEKPVLIREGMLKFVELLKKFN